MKKLVFIITFLIIACMTGCGSETESQPKTKIVVSSYPIYEWVLNIAPKEKVDITLLQKDVDFRNYTPSSEDVKRIKESDLFIYIGGESDEWAKDILTQNPDIKSLNLLDNLDYHKAEISEGKYDEYIWISPNEALICAKTISSALSDLYLNAEDQMDSNTDKYIDELSKIHVQYCELADVPNKVLVFADNFPFRYLANDYNINCLSTSDNNPESLSEIAKQVDALNIKKIIVSKGGDQSIANAIVQSTQTKDQKVVEIESLCSGSSKPYLEVLKDNLEIIKSAFPQEAPIAQNPEPVTTESAGEKAPSKEVPVVESPVPEPSTSAPEPQAKTSVQLPVMNIMQNPELPQGCEVTSLAIAMNYKGYGVDKCILSDNYLPKWPDLSGNPEYYYLREPRSDGYYCFAGALCSAVNNFNADTGSNVSCRNLTGSSPEVLYSELDNNNPVIVWGTLKWQNPYVINGLYQNLHCMVLSGYTNDTVTITDPIYGLTTVSKNVFENIWARMGHRALVVE